MRYWPILLVLSLGALATVWSASVVRERAGIRQRIVLERLAEQQVLAIEREVASTLEIVRSLAAFYDSSERVEREEFDLFARRLLAGHAHLRALEWIPRVRENERAECELAAREEGLAQFAITERDAAARLVPAGARASYYPVLYATPLEGVESALGYDLGSEPKRAAAIEQAARTGEVAVTECLALGQTGRDSLGVLAFCPVYVKGLPLETENQREHALDGVVLGVLQLADLVSSTVTDASAVRAGLRIALLDESDSLEPRVLAAGGAELALAASLGGLIADHPVVLGSRSWRIRIDPDPRVWGSPESASFLRVIIPGFSITVILAAYLGTILRRRQIVELVVRERTRELASAQRDLESRSVTLSETNAELLERNRDLDEFSYVASHDLQEPLRKLVSFSSMLEGDLGGDLPDRAREDVRYITESAQRMSQLISDLLSFSRAGKTAMRVERVNLDECLDTALEALSSAIEESGTRIEREPLPSVDGDRTMLAQLFQNLIANSIKFSREGLRPRVTVRSREVDDRVEISVEDNGIGIEQEFKERVFEPFKRLHGRAEYDGSGIGLTICSKTILRHGGRIRVESEPGSGSTFFFTLTRAAEAAST